MKKRIISSVLLVVLLLSLSCTATARSSSDTVVSVVANYNHTYALMKNGDLYAWGANYKGSVGVGVESNDIVMPVKIMKDVKSIHNNGLAIKNNGELWGWGEIVGSYSPKKIAKNVKTVVCQRYNAFALYIKNNGSLWCFASNKNGKQMTDSKVGKPVKVADNIKDVTVGTKSESKSYVLALTKNGKLLGWGDNSLGEIATGNTKYVKRPKTILTNVSKVTSKEGTIAAIRNNGSLYMWGENTYGQVGIGSKKKHILTENKVHSNIKNVVLGKGYTVAISKNNDLYYWGATKYFYDGLTGYFKVDKSINSPKKIADNVSSA